MKELTKAEEQVMQYLWKLKKGFLKDIVDKFPEPRPAYTTVSTVIRVLVNKQFIGFQAYGKIHEYYPLISKSEYFGIQFKATIKDYFNGSPTNFATFFAGDHDLNLTQLEEIRKIVEEQIQKRQKNE
jgi:BlaI family transcriptional regulator, penicillinase repressor